MSRPRGVIRPGSGHTCRARLPLTPVMALCLLSASLLIAASPTGCRKEKAVAPSSSTLEVAATLNPLEIRIGDPAHLTVTAVHPAGGDLSFPDFNDGRTIAVRDQKSNTKPLQGGMALTTVEYDLTSFELGEHELKAGTVTFTGKDATVLETAFPKTAIKAISTLEDENTPLRDIKGLTTWPASIIWRIVSALAAVMLAAACFFLARWLISRRRDRKDNGPPPIPPHVAAFKALWKLKAEKWIEHHQVEPFYRELSRIVRRYLEDRFGLKAPERTTEEFIREAATSRVLSITHQSLVFDFLEQSDLVKFARHRPGRENMRDAYATAERLINETKPSFEPLVKTTTVHVNEPAMATDSREKDKP